MDNKDKFVQTIAKPTAAVIQGQAQVKNGFPLLKELDEAINTKNAIKQQEIITKIFQDQNYAPYHKGLYAIAREIKPFK